jgi:hypothetical protein
MLSARSAVLPATARKFAGLHLMEHVPEVVRMATPAFCRRIPILPVGQAKAGAGAAGQHLQVQQLLLQKPLHLTFLPRSATSSSRCSGGNKDMTDNLQ